MGLASFFTVEPCPKCGGQGQVIEKPCKKCRGSGTRRGTKHLEFSLPPGVDDGDYTLPGEGELVPGGVNGDLIVRVRVQRHPRFRRDGGNIYCDEEVSMADAALGRKLEVRTLDGAEEVRIDPGTQPNHIVRLRGRGVPARGTGRGDLYVRIVVAIPRKLSKGQRKALEGFDSL